MAVTFHTAGGNLGCSTFARAPFSRILLLANVIFFTDAVQKCQFSTSVSTLKIMAGAAPVIIVLVIVYFLP